MSFDKLYFFDEYDNDGSRPGSPGKYFGSAGDVGLRDFVTTVIESLGNVVLLVIFLPRGIDYKVGRLIGSFWRPKS